MRRNKQTKRKKIHFILPEVTSSSSSSSLYVVLAFLMLGIECRIAAGVGVGEVGTANKWTLLLLLNYRTWQVRFWKQVNLVPRTISPEKGRTRPLSAGKTLATTLLQSLNYIRLGCSDVTHQHLACVTQVVLLRPMTVLLRTYLTRTIKFQQVESIMG